jgi:hypothetical protein
MAKWTETSIPDISLLGYYHFFDELCGQYACQLAMWATEMTREVNPHVLLPPTHLQSHPLAVAALTAAREAYVDVIHFTWQPIYRPLLSMKNPVPEDSPLWLLRPEIPAMLVVPGMEEESKEGWKDTEGWEETEEEEEEVQGQEVAGEAMEVVEEEQGQG